MKKVTKKSTSKKTISKKNSEKKTISGQPANLLLKVNVFGGEGKMRDMGVVITNLSTGETRFGYTGNSGSCRFENLAEGPYTIAAISNKSLDKTMDMEEIILSNCGVACKIITKKRKTSSATIILEALDPIGDISVKTIKTIGPNASMIEAKHVGGEWEETKLSDSEGNVHFDPPIEDGITIKFTALHLATNEVQIVNAITPLATQPFIINFS